MEVMWIVQFHEPLERIIQLLFIGMKIWWKLIKPFWSYWHWLLFIVDCFLAFLCFRYFVIYLIGILNIHRCNGWFVIDLDTLNLLLYIFIIRNVIVLMVNRLIQRSYWQSIKVMSCMEILLLIVLKATIMSRDSERAWWFSRRDQSGWINNGRFIIHIKIV